MTKLLKQAFNKVSSLPLAEQNAFAERILAELQADERWDKTFEETADTLALLVAEAEEEYDRGETEPLDIERLA